MDPQFLPKFRTDDYQAFRRILSADLPGTYDEWFQLHTKQCTDLIKLGEPFREIEVDPNEFGRFIATTGHAANYKALRIFTAEKASGYQY